jgi:hypothetical protein
LAKGGVREGFRLVLHVFYLFFTCHGGAMGRPVPS